MSNPGMDPNKTMLTGPGGFDPMKTQAMTGPMIDPQRTSALTPTQLGIGAPTGPSIQAIVTPSRDATMANGPAREQFLVELVAQGVLPPTAGMLNRTPVNICLCIDRSGSMEGMPLEYAKQACSYVVDMLNPQDVLSIVTFEETVDVLMPPQAVMNKPMIHDGIRRIMAGNTTNLYDGVTLAMHQIMALQDAARATRIVVLTDGEPTAGNKDFNALVNLAGGVKERGITCTFLGFGPEYNEELLASMAKRAGGNYNYIARPEMIPEVFRLELEKVMTTVARNLTLEIKTARWVELKAPVTGSPATVQLADLERGASLHKVFDFEFSNHPLGWYRVASGKLTYDDLGLGRQSVVDVDFVMEFTADSAKYSAPQNPKVSGAAQVALASKQVEKTILGLKTGMLTAAGAMQELQKTQMLLVQEGRTAEAQEVTMALQAIRSGNSDEANKTLMGTALNLDQGKR